MSAITIISPDTTKNLHLVACQAGLGHRCFSRPLSPSSSTVTATDSSVIERMLDHLLTQLNDDSKYVEYWTKQEWRSIEAHADVDEFLAKTQDDKPSR